MGQSFIQAHGARELSSPQLTDSDDDFFYFIMLYDNKNKHRIWLLINIMTPKYLIQLEAYVFQISDKGLGGYDMVNLRAYLE